MVLVLPICYIFLMDHEHTQSILFICRPCKHRPHSNLQRELLAAPTCLHHRILFNSKSNFRKRQKYLYDKKLDF